MIRTVCIPRPFDKPDLSLCLCWQFAPERPEKQFPRTLQAFQFSTYIYVPIPLVLHVYTHMLVLVVLLHYHFNIASAVPPMCDPAWIRGGGKYLKVQEVCNNYCRPCLYGDLNVGGQTSLSFLQIIKDLVWKPSHNSIYRESNPVDQLLCVGGCNNTWEQGIKSSWSAAVCGWL